MLAYIKNFDELELKSMSMIVFGKEQRSAREVQLLLSNTIN